MRKGNRFILSTLLTCLFGCLYADNLSMGTVQLVPGESRQVEISLSNSTKYTAFQFDMVLPEGVAVAKSDNNELVALLNGNRANRHQLHVAKVGSKTYRFLAFSMENNDFLGTEGVLLDVTLTASTDISDEVKTIGLRSLLLVEADGSQHALDDQTINVSIFSGDKKTVAIGKSGKSSYCGDKSLDFSFSDEVKAYIATGYDKDAEIIWLTRVMDVPAGVPVLIKGVAEKTYQVPVTDSENSYYKNMFKGNNSGETVKVEETDGDLVNYYLSGDGVFKSVKGYANIGNNKCYLQLPGTFKDAVEGSSQTVTVGASGKASYAAPVDLDFTNVEGLKAFTATGYDKSTKTIWLTRVMKAQKGEGLLLKGDPKDYEIPSMGVQSVYMNMFIGNTSGEKIQVNATSDDGSETNYYLSGDGTFKSVNGYVNINDKKCYLALPTSMVAVASTRSAEENYKLDESEMIQMPIVRSIESDGDDTTAIKDLTPALSEGEGDWYTLQGQRVAKPGKGLYIRNGKVVIVR